MKQKQRDLLIDRIQNFPEELEALVGDLRRHQLDTPCRGNGWTIRQVVHHFIDSHVNLYVRMKLILTDYNPTLNAYDEERWADLSDASISKILSSLTILKGLHNRVAETLQNVGISDFSRIAYHPEYDEISLEELVHNLIDHCRMHMDKIKDLIRSRGWKEI